MGESCCVSCGCFLSPQIGCVNLPCFLSCSRFSCILLPFSCRRLDSSYNSMTAIISTRGYFKDNLFFLYLIYFGRYMYLYIHVYLCDLYHSLSFCQSLCLSFYLSLCMQLRLCVWVCVCVLDKKRTEGWRKKNQVEGEKQKGERGTCLSTRLWGCWDQV